jgi:DNA polymerase-3 subunit delta
MVVVRDFEKLSKDDTKRLINYIKNPNQYTCLVIDTLDGSILKDDPSISVYASVLKFYELGDTEISSWISRFVSSKGKTIEEGAIEILKELQGRDLLNLSQEMEKLITYAGTRKSITLDDAQALVGKSVVSSAFEIAHAAACLDASKAIAIVHELVSLGKRPHEIVGLLAWHFKTLLKIKDLVASGQNEYSITQALRLPRKKAGEFFTQSASYSYEDIRAKLEALLEADLNIKRARFSPSLVLEFAVIRLCLLA